MARATSVSGAAVDERHADDGRSDLLERERPEAGDVSDERDAERQPAGDVRVADWDGLLFRREAGQERREATSVLTGSARSDIFILTGKRSRRRHRTERRSSPDTSGMRRPALDYADQRYHNPGTGRFLTPDPYHAAAGGGNDAGNPSSWNEYAYGLGDPIRFERSPCYSPVAAIMMIAETMTSRANVVMIPTGSIRHDLPRRHLHCCD